MRVSSDSSAWARRKRFCTEPLDITSTASSSPGVVTRKRRCLSVEVCARGEMTIAAVPVSSESSLPVSRSTFIPGSKSSKRERMRW